MAKVMVIAGGDWQIELVKKLKSMGHFVICSNLYPVSPAFPYADACEVADVLDKEANLAIARRHRPDAVISDQSDIAVPTVAYLNERLRLRGIGTDLADLFTDKSRQRAFCAEHGFPAPDSRVCRDAADAAEMLERYGRIVIKPIDSQSSRGVFLIETPAQLEARYEETLSFSNRRKEFLAEEHVDGAEFTIDGLVVNGRHYPLCVSVKEMYPRNPMISRTQSYSYRSDKYDYDALRAANRAFIEATGLPMGLTHSEYRLRGGTYYLIEAGARGGGSNLSAKIVPFLSGVDNYEYLIREALGETVSEEAVRDAVFPENRYAVMRFFDFGEGTVERVEGVDFLRNHPLLLDYQMNVKPGDTLRAPKYGRLRPGHFIIGGENAAQVRREAEAILRRVRVTFR